MAITTLRKLRKARGLMQKNMSRKMGVAQSRVSVIERGPVGSLRVETLGRYVAALGGRLKMYVEFDGWTIDLDWESVPDPDMEDL